MHESWDRLPRIGDMLFCTLPPSPPCLNCWGLGRGELSRKVSLWGPYKMTLGTMHSIQMGTFCNYWGPHTHSRIRQVRTLWIGVLALNSECVGFHVKGFTKRQHFYILNVILYALRIKIKMSLWSRRCSFLIEKSKLSPNTHRWHKKKAFNKKKLHLYIYCKCQVVSSKGKIMELWIVYKICSSML